MTPGAAPRQLLLVGAGKMGSAMLDGWLRTGLDPSAISVIEPFPTQALIAQCTRLAVSLNPAPVTMVVPEVVVLAVKPQMLADAAHDVSALVGVRTLLVSIMAGKSIADIKAHVPTATAIIRAMPNTPAAVGRGITGVFANANVTREQIGLADALLSAIGTVVFLDHEAQIDAVTAVSGSGPAYVFYLAECLAKAGEAAGLPAALAAQFARKTVEGAGELLHRSQDIAPAQLRINVTSPGGTTAAALDVLMAENGLEPLLRAAVAAAKRRAGELSG